MNPLSRHPTTRLLVFALWLPLSLWSGSVHSAQTEPTNVIAIESPKTASETSRSVTTEILDADPEEREWTTNDERRSLRLRPGTKIVIGSHSRVRKLPTIPVSLGSKDYAKSAFCIELEAGRIDVEIDSHIRPIYGLVVRAPHKVGAIVKAGRTTITTTDESVTIAARSGKDMMFAIDERWRPLRVGKAVTLSNKSPQGAQRTLLQAPRPRIDAPLALTLGKTTTPQHLSWPRVIGSVGYLVRVHQQLENKVVLVRERRVTETSLPLTDLKAGRYYATVSTLDEVQLESEPSATENFRIVEALLPPNALMTGNTIQLPEQERLQFINPEGLELSYGSLSNYFVNAPQSIGLFDGASVQVRLRERGSSQETRIRLEPLDSKVTVDLSPKQAVWPGAPVTITIGAQRRDGTSTPIDETLVPVVTVNSESVRMNWNRTANTLSGTLDQPVTPGPWVVRVLLHDARGRVIARDFLEVAKRQATTNRTELSP